MSQSFMEDVPGPLHARPASVQGEGPVDDQDFVRRSVPQQAEDNDYDNDEFAARFRSDSMDSGWTRDSIGNPRRRSGDMLRTIMQMEGAEGMRGGVQWHRQPRQVNRVPQQSHVSDMSGSLSLSDTDESQADEPAQQPARRRSFFGGSWNPLRWNWGRLFGRRR